MADNTLPTNDVPPPLPAELRRDRSEHRNDVLLKSTSLLLYLLVICMCVGAVVIAFFAVPWIAMAAAMIASSVGIGTQAHKPYVLARARALERERALEQRRKDWHAAWQVVERQ